MSSCWFWLNCTVLMFSDYLYDYDSNLGVAILIWFSYFYLVLWFLGHRWVVCSSVSAYSFVASLVITVKMLHIARHLAAKFGTFSPPLVWRVIFVTDDLYLEWCCFFFILILSWWELFSSYMDDFSFIKLETCRLICCWLRWLFNLFLSFLNLRWKIWWFWSEYFVLVFCG